MPVTDIFHLGCLHSEMFHFLKEDEIASLGVFEKKCIQKFGRIVYQRRKQELSVCKCLRRDCLGVKKSFGFSFWVFENIQTLEGIFQHVG